MLVISVFAEISRTLTENSFYPGSREDAPDRPSTATGETDETVPPLFPVNQYTFDSRGLPDHPEIFIAIFADTGNYYFQGIPGTLLI
jgi:hypothetical protein